MSTKDTKPAAPAPATEVVEAKSTAVAMPMSWRERMQAVAVKTAEAEKPQGGFISFKSGRMSIGDTAIPGDKMQCIIVDYLFHNKYYDTPYNAKVSTPPACYAFSREELDLEPDDCEDPQSDSCAECPQNEWGSAGEGKRGKACTNSRRLFLLAGDALNDPSKIGKLDFFQCDLPPTSVKNFSKFVNEDLPPGLPPFAFVVEMSVKPHPTSLFQVHFKPLEQIKNEAALEQLAGRNWRSEQEPMPVYPTKEEMAERAAGGTQSAKY